MRNLIITFLFLLTLISCIRYPDYNRLTRKNNLYLNKDISYEGLPEPVKDTLSFFYDRESIDVPNYISLDSNYVFHHIGYWDMDSEKLIIPFGLYFKLNKTKFFVDYSWNRGPYLYFDQKLYFPRRGDNNLLEDYHNWKFNCFYLHDYWLKPLKSAS